MIQSVPKFSCPRCGGSYFGTHFPAGPEFPGVGVCQGDDGKPGCGLRWDRNEKNDKAVGIWFDPVRAYGEGWFR